MIVDTAAGFATCCREEFNYIVDALAQQGTKLVVMPDHRATIRLSAVGICGKANFVEVRLVPCCLGKQLLFIEVLVVADKVLPLLPISILDAGKALIDLDLKQVTWRWPSAEAVVECMYRIASGHRLLNVCNFMDCDDW